MFGEVDVEFGYYCVGFVFDVGGFGVGGMYVEVEFGVVGGFVV